VFLLLDWLSHIMLITSFVIHCWKLSRL
jgi:hypothetical protein